MPPGNRFWILEGLSDNQEDRKSTRDIPPELLEQIFTWAKVDRDRPTKLAGDNPNKISPNEKYPLFKTLRQVCSTWNEIATPLLFRTVTLLSHIGSWRDLDNIASAPWLAPHVWTIQLATTRHLDYEESYERWLYFFGRQLDPKRENYVSRPNGGPFSRMRSDFNSYYQRYRRWCNAEQQMEAHWRHQTAPPLRLGLLPGLRRVETIGHEELAVIKREYAIESEPDGPSSWRWYKNGTRREIETASPDGVGALEDTFSSHLHLFLTAVHSCGVHLQTLTVRSTLELMSCGYPPALPTLHRSYPLAPQGLRRLELYLSDNDEWHMPYIDRTCGHLAEWLSMLDSLEEFSVVVRDIENSYNDSELNIFQMLSDITWPRLRSVTLVLMKTNCGDFLDFAERHRGSLELLRIKISDTVIGNRQRQDIISSIGPWLTVLLHDVASGGFKRVKFDGWLDSDLCKVEEIGGWQLCGNMLEPERSGV